MTLWRTMAVTVLGFVMCGFAAAQEPSRDSSLLARQLRAGRELELNGQVEQAKQQYRDLLAADPDGPLAPQAMLGLARLTWPVETPDQLGRRTIDLKAFDEARALLEQLVRKFGADQGIASDAAWRLALMRLEPGTPQFDPDQALSLLTSLPTLYPASIHVPDALTLAAQLQLEAGRPARARVLAFRLLADYPENPLAARAWTVLARADAAEGRSTDALAELGEARESVRGDDRAAADAVALATLLDRLMFSGARGARPLEPERGGGILSAARVRAMKVGPDGRLFALVPGDKQLLVYPVGGGNPEIRAAQNADAFTIDRWGRLWTGAGRILTPPAGTGTMPALPDRTEIVALAPAGPRGVWIADGKGRRVVRFEPPGGIVATAQLPERADPVALAPADTGGVWVLDTKNLAVHEIGPDGLPRRSIQIGGVAPDAVDIDRDALGNLYVLDADAPAVIVFGRDGQVLVRQPLLKEGEQGFSRPALIAVDRFGSVAVYDSRKRRTLWLR